MKVLSYILGAILTIGGISCLFSPESTFFATGYMMAILLLVFGIFGIVGVILKRRMPISLLASIPATIIGIIAIIRPGTTLVFDAFMIYMFAAWFIIQGITTIIIAVQLRRQIRGWGFTLAIGIISTILGIYAFIYPAISVVAIGIQIGIFLIETGIDIIALTAAVSAAEEVLRSSEDDSSGDIIDMENRNDSDE